MNTTRTPSHPAQIPARVVSRLPELSIPPPANSRARGGSAGRQPAGFARGSLLLVSVLTVVVIAGVLALIAAVALLLVITGAIVARTFALLADLDGRQRTAAHLRLTHDTRPHGRLTAEK